MLVLSDASGSSTRIPTDGYLTGYALFGAGKHVLARTWSAPEMSRPGCVWTNSLLIDFADLARLASADKLVDRFMRPSHGDTSRFVSTLDIYSNSCPAKTAAGDLSRVAEWFGGLYGSQ